MMKCENCQAEINPDTLDGTVCPECGGPLPLQVPGFENAVKIQKILKAIYDASGKNILTNTFRFTALINDCLADFDKERRLLVNMLAAGVLKGMLEETDKNIAVMRARSTMQNDCFIIESATEFVIICFSYLLGWTYEPPVRTNNAAEKAIAESKPDEASKEKSKPLDIDDRVFRPADAAKFRFSRNITIPEGVTKIEGFCFDRFGSVRTIEMPETLMSIGEYAFSECKHLRSAELPKSLRILQQGAFSQCTNLVMIKIPEGVLEIADNTFLYCQSLEVVEVPATVTSIGTNAFSGCEKLHKLFLHDSVKYIDEEAFLQCPELVIKCPENSYVHKYCLSHDIKFETVAKEIDI